MSVKIEDVDDYINPSQACINPLFTSTKKAIVQQVMANMKLRRTVATTTIVSQNEEGDGELLL